MLDNLKFAQYVNEERKKLIKSTRERGVYVADNAQLSEVVARNSEIQPYEATSPDKVSVTFLDADGTLLKREYLDTGGTATAPSNPTLDSDYLIFDSWSDTELTNITESKTICATYTTKDNATYIFIRTPAADKTITLNFGGTITSVDWGDGTTDATLSHTYSAIGDYVIKVIGGTSIKSLILSNDSDNKCVLKCYISNSITTIGSYAFRSSNKLIQIILSNSITKIDAYAFNSCTSLLNIILPDSITSIGRDVFHGCTSILNIILSNNLNSIGSEAFRSCRILSSIELPSSINSSYGIDIGAFNECYSLSNVKLPNNMKKIFKNMFEYCHALSAITLPENLTTIEEKAFYDCSVLSNINLPETLISIGNYAFYNCNLLNNIIIPDSVTSIGDSAFSGCQTLSNITLPASITKLGNSVFSYCSSLKSITLPSNIIDISNGAAFYGCVNLEKLVMNANVVIPINSSSFADVAYNIKFYVPDNLVEDYKVATNWVNFADRIYPLTSLGV